VPVKIVVGERIETAGGTVIVSYVIVDTDPPFSPQSPHLTPVAHLFFADGTYSLEAERRKLAETLEEYKKMKQKLLAEGAFE